MKVFAIATVTLLVVSFTAAAPSIQDNRIESENGIGTIARAAKYLHSCFENDDITTCLAIKGITALNRAARSNNIELINGIQFKRDPASAVQRSGKVLSENDIYSELPAEPEERNGRLLDIAMKTTAEFFDTHNLEVKLPAEATQEVARAFDEGRGKLKKMMGPLALAIGAKIFAIVPILIIGLALLTTKALIVAKLAFVLALFVGGARLLGGFGSKFGGGIGGGYNSNLGWASGSNGGWSSGASSAYPYARSISNDGQGLAYSGQAPAE